MIDEREQFEACQTPLVDLLRGVPIDARLVVDDGPYSTHFIPVGKHCHDAADALNRAATAAAQPAPQEAQAVEVISDGAYLQMARKAGAHIPEFVAGFGPPRFDSFGEWGRFCDAVRAATPPAKLPQEAQPVEQERELLRSAQAVGVMPLVGPLLDAWEWLDPDTKSNLREQAPSLVRAMSGINHAMEDAPQPARVEEQDSRSLLETLAKIADFLDIDCEAAKVAPGNPSDVYIDAIRKWSEAQPARAGAGLSDERIADIGIKHGLCTFIKDGGYRADVLWFDGELFDFARDIIAAMAAAGAGKGQP